MSVAFWSCKLSGGKAVEVQPPEGYVLNVQQAAITGEGHAVIKVKTVSVEGDKIDAVIATLRAKTTDQVNLSLVFGYDVPVSFVAEGKADVYLSGYYQPGPEEEGEDEDEENDFDNYDSEEDSENDEDEEEGSDDDDEEANIRNAEAAIAKLGAARKAIKNAPAEDSEDDSEDEEEDSEDDSEEEKIDSAFVAKMVAKHGLAGKAPKSSRVEELESEEDSEEGSEEESEEEEAPPVKVQKTVAKGVVTPSGQKPKPTTPAQNNNNNKPKTPNGGNNNNQNNKTPNNNQGGNKNNNSAHKSGDKRKR